MFWLFSWLAFYEYSLRWDRDKNCEVLNIVCIEIFVMGFSNSGDDLARGTMVHNTREKNPQR